MTTVTLRATTVNSAPATGGENPRQLTTDGFETLEQFQEWSPDGKELLVESRRTGHTDLWVLPIDGGKARQLTRDVRDDYGGVWLSDGQWIAFLSNRGRQTRCLGEEGAEFTPDGKPLLFRRVMTVQRITAVDVSKMLAAKR